MKANVLFTRMQRGRKYFAVIIDEYGGFEGIITLHDLMEALVGDMYEEDEVLAQNDIQHITENSWRIMGSADIGDVSHTLGIDLTKDDLYDTFNGYLCSVIQRVPNDGEAFECETDELSISVKSVKNHIVESAIVTKK
jgi:putative hemolysin